MTIATNNYYTKKEKRTTIILIIIKSNHKDHNETEVKFHAGSIHPRRVALFQVYMYAPKALKQVEITLSPLCSALTQLKSVIRQAFLSRGVTMTDSRSK